MLRPPPTSTLFPYTTLFRSEIGQDLRRIRRALRQVPGQHARDDLLELHRYLEPKARQGVRDRKSTRLNSSHVEISYAVFCLKKKTDNSYTTATHTNYARKMI